MHNSLEWIVIVGATGAFGSVMTKRFIDRGYGVVAVARSDDSLQQLAAGCDALIPCVADISQDSAIDAIRVALPGPVRMAIHGPGVAVGGGVLTIATAALVDAVNIKVGGMLRLVRAVDGHLHEGSRLVGIGGHYGFEPSVYAAAAGAGNAALMNVIRQLSLAYGARGVTAHLVAPGPADTERLRRVAADRARINGITVDEVLDEMRAESSLGQFTQPEQVTWALEMLLAPEATAMTGSAWMLDAGRRRGLP